MSQKIKSGDIVWAKVKGYPWWPGIVRDSRIQSNLREGGGGYRGQVQAGYPSELHLGQLPVSLALHPILTNLVLSSTLPSNKIADFKSYYKKYNKGKDRNLANAVKAAMRICNKESSYEGKELSVDSGRGDDQVQEEEGDLL